MDTIGAGASMPEAAANTERTGEHAKRLLSLRFRAEENAAIALIGANPDRYSEDNPPPREEIDGMLVNFDILVASENLLITNQDNVQSQTGSEASRTLIIGVSERYGRSYNMSPELFGYLLGIEDPKAFDEPDTDRIIEAVSDIVHKTGLKTRVKLEREPVDLTITPEQVRDSRLKEARVESPELDHSQLPPTHRPLLKPEQERDSIEKYLALWGELGEPGSEKRAALYAHLKDRIPAAVRNNKRKYETDLGEEQIEREISGVEQTLELIILHSNELLVQIRPVPGSHIGRFAVTEMLSSYVVGKNDGKAVSDMMNVEVFLDILDIKTPPELFEDARYVDESEKLMEELRVTFPDWPIILQVVPVPYVLSSETNNIVGGQNG